MSRAFLLSSPHERSSAGRSDPGARLKRVLLYGSHARGDHRPDSDYDILVVLEGPVDRWPETSRLAELSTTIAVETAGEAIFSLRPVTEEHIQERTGFMHNVRREMIEL